MLQYAQQGQEVTETAAISLAAAVDDAWTIATDDSPRAALTVETDQRTKTAEADSIEDGDLGVIQTNGDCLDRLLENLFRNAVDHSAQAVTVTIGSLEDGFYVEDDGPGIPPDRREDIFETGYTTAEEGMGFGLSIVKQMVEVQEWDIRATDGHDGGARFEITGVEFVK